MIFQKETTESFLKALFTSLKTLTSKGHLSFKLLSILCQSETQLALIVEFLLVKNLVTVEKEEEGKLMLKTALPDRVFDLQLRLQDVL